MSIFKKALALLLVVALTAAIAVNVTLAYLVDEKSDVNVMTLGNVEIEQIEQERDAQGNLVPFSPGKPAYPAVGPIKWATEGVKVNDREYKVFTPDLKNVVDKIVTVNNVGKSPAFIRTVVAIEAPGYDAEDYIHINYNGTDTTISGPVVTKIDSTDYVIFTFTYKDALAAGAKSAPSLVQLFLDSKADNEYCAQFGPSWEVLVVSQAVQTEGFDDATTALNTAFGEITDTSHPWTDTVLVDGNNEAELLNALTSGKDVIVNTDIVTVETANDSGTVNFNGNGTDVTLAGAGDGSYGYLSFLPETNKDATVSNLSVTGSGFVEIGHYQTNVNGVYTVNNLTIKDMTSTLANGDKGFTLGCTFAHYGKATLNNCVMTGAKSLDNAIIPVDAGFVNGTTTVVNGGEYGTVYCWSHSIVTINGADVDTIYVSPINGSVTIKAGTHVDTIKVAYGSSDANVTKARLQKLVVEDGATVGEIVFRGTSYTVAKWNEFVEKFA